MLLNMLNDLAEAMKALDGKKTLSLCWYVLRPRRGLGPASPSLEAPRLQVFETRELFHQENRKGKIVMTKTSRNKELVLGSFLGSELIWFLETELGPPLCFKCLGCFGASAEICLSEHSSPDMLFSATELLPMVRITRPRTSEPPCKA